MQPYAVEVIIANKKSIKEFLTKVEMRDFIKKAEGLKAKAPTLLVNIIREPKVIKAGPKLDEAKEDCPAWERLETADQKGVFNYKCVPVQKKHGVFYCPHCHGYKKMEKLDYDNGLFVNGCPECEMSDQDFYIKTANNLWGKG